jgi:hypothetical protein
LLETAPPLLLQLSYVRIKRAQLAPEGVTVSATLFFVGLVEVLLLAASQALAKIFGLLASNGQARQKLRRVCL